MTQEMATANPGMVAGTYYLKGGDDGKAFLDNAKIIYDAFGGVGCSSDNTSAVIHIRQHLLPASTAMFRA